MVTHWDIYNFWKDKYITEAGDIVSWRDPKWRYRAVISDGVPCCWGCGIPADRSIKGTEWLENEPDWDADLKSAWSSKEVSSGLNKCHIYAKQFGGKDSEDNLFLLCEKCHAESPDTKNPKAFFRWVCRKRKERKGGYLREWKVTEMLEQEFSQAGTSFVEAIVNAGPDIDLSELSAFVDENAGLHGASVSTSSIIASAVDWLLSKSKR